MADAGPSSRPRRSTRTPAKRPTQAVSAAATPQRAKRKARDPAEQLEHLLTNAKSKLTSMDISDIVNYENYLNLSPDSQELLCALLPPTAFSTYQPALDPTHPANEPPPHDPPGSSTNDNSAFELERSPATLDPLFLGSPFLLGAAHTFQDHIFSGWRAPKAADTLARYEQGVRDGTLHAEWKDEEWAREHPPPKRSLRMLAEDLDLVALVKRGLIREGDLLVYKRTFPTLGVTVEKDLLVQSMHPQSSAITVLLSPTTQTSLPPDLLVVAPPPPAPPTLTTDGILSAAELEDALLDVDGRVARAERLAAAAPPPRARREGDSVPLEVLVAARAAKALAVWRWRDEVLADVEMQRGMPRGARELLGTVFYLRRS